MKINEFAIWKYGPLSGAGKMELSSFNLFYGPNEQGKTLTIDALVKLLLGKGYKEFKDINRVDQTPEGYLIIEMNGGETEKLPEAGDLTRFTGLTAAECRNIFIIRDSDLSISQENEFYKGVTNRLTGLRSEEIEHIKARLRELARLTPGGDFQDTSPQKLKSSLARARQLVEQISEQARSLEEEGYDKFEIELAHIKGQIASIGQQLKRYEEARRREIYQRGSDALQSLREACRKAAALDKFNRDDLERWQLLQSKTEPLQKKEQGTREDLGSAQEELRQDREQVRRYELLVQELERTAALFSEQVEPKLKDYLNVSRELAGQESLGGNLFTPRAAMFAAALLLISLAGAILRPSLWWFFPLAGGSLAFILIFIGIRFGLARKKGRLAASWQEISARAAELGARADHSEELLGWWGDFKRRQVDEEQRFNEAKNKVALQDTLVERFESELNDLADEMKQAEQKLRKLMQLAKVSSLQEYRQKLEAKLELENQVQQQKAVLESHFSLPGNLSLPEKISTWESRLKSLEPYAGLGTGLYYSEQETSQLEHKLERFRGRQEELEEKWSKYRQQLQEIEQSVNGIFSEEIGFIHCQTLADLEAAGKSLQQWIDTHKDSRQWALTATELFDQIAAEEEQKVLELFGKESLVSRYFSEITSSRYGGVLFDPEQRKIMVSPAEGPALCAGQLSGGAYDQLYFSIRLALGEKLLAGGRGFFILDDPFIKADPDRLRILLNMLLQVADSGWQVLYFSAKGEVRDTLQGELQSGRVKEFNFG
ncbi:MAG TPA: AAA family ATPase [Firmicutes bacterium]|nr:AAA family ATPase [Bacillota bacterium]